MLLQIQQNRSGLENNETVASAVDEDRYSPVRVQLDEPRLFLDVFGDVDFLDAGFWIVVRRGRRRRRSTDLLVVDFGAVDGFEFFEEDAGFATVRGASGVKEKRLGHAARGS